MSLDDWIAATREVMAKRFPTADWLSVVIHCPGLANTVLTVSPGPPSAPPAERMLFEPCFYEPPDAASP